MSQIEKFNRIDRLKIRYLGEGNGDSVLLLHGASPGSSVAERARLAKEQVSSLSLHLFDDCKRLVRGIGPPSS